MSAGTYSRGFYDRLTREDPRSGAQDMNFGSDQDFKILGMQIWGLHESEKKCF